MCGAFLANTGIAIPKYLTKNPSYFQFVHHMSDVDMFLRRVKKWKKGPYSWSTFPQKFVGEWI